jgi:hypothetical protein
MSEHETGPPTKSSLIIAAATQILEHAGVERSYFYTDDGWRLSEMGPIKRRRSLGSQVLERRISNAIDFGYTSYTEKIHSEAAEGYLPVLREGASIVIIGLERSGILARDKLGSFCLDQHQAIDTTDLDVAQYVIEENGHNMIDMWDMGIRIGLNPDLPEPSDDLADAWLKDLGVVAAKAGCDLRL